MKRMELWRPARIRENNPVEDIGRHPAEIRDPPNPTDTLTTAPNLTIIPPPVSLVFLSTNLVVLRKNAITNLVHPAEMVPEDA